MHAIHAFQTKLQVSNVICNNRYTQAKSPDLKVNEEKDKGKKMHEVNIPCPCIAGG